MRLLHSTDFNELKKMSEIQLPHTVALYNMVSIAMLRGDDESNSLEVFANAWPQPTVIIARCTYAFQGIPNYPSLFVFPLVKTIEESDVVRLVETVFDESIALCGSFGLNLWPSNSLCTLEEVILKNWNGNVLIDVFSTTDTFWSPANRICFNIILPDGFAFDTLRENEADLVDLLWPHRFDGSLRMIRHLIKSMPNCCVRTEDGALAGFALIHDIMGNETHLYTMPEYRARGIAKCIEMALAEKLTSLNCIPYKFIVKENEVAMQMTKRSSFWQDVQLQLSWLRVYKVQR